MSLQNVWFERAWQRYLIHKLASRDLRASPPNRNETQMIHAAMTADAAVLAATIKQVTVGYPANLAMLLTIRADEDYRQLEIIENVRKRVDSYRAVGVDIQYFTVTAQP